MSSEKSTQPANSLEPPAPEWVLRLYVAGMNHATCKTLANLENICDKHLAGQYSIEIIDLQKEPELADTDQIIALPTLVRRLPEPVRKIIGDLSDFEKVLVGLEIEPAP